MSRLAHATDLEEKCYIISFQDDPIDIHQSSICLGWELVEIEDGVLTFRSGSPMNETLIYHYEELGYAIGTFTQDEADSLRNHELIASVEEDQESQTLDFED